MDRRDTWTVTVKDLVRITFLPRRFFVIVSWDTKFDSIKCVMIVYLCGNQSEITQTQRLGFISILTLIQRGGRWRGLGTRESCLADTAYFRHKVCHYFVVCSNQSRCSLCPCRIWNNFLTGKKNIWPAHIGISHWCLWAILYCFNDGLQAMGTLWEHIVMSHCKW